MYLTAIDRLNAAIATELAREQPEALRAMLADYKDKYRAWPGSTAWRATWRNTRR